MSQATGTSTAEQGEGERVVARLRPHARAMFWPSIVLIAAIGAMGWFAGRFDQSWQNIAVLAGGGLVIILLWFLPLLSWLSKRYVITSRRLIVRSGLFVRLRQELLHSRGYDVTVRKAGLQPLFGSGNVLINTGIEHPFVLRDVPSADLVQAALHDLMEKSLNPIAARRQAEASRDDDATTVWGSR